MVVVLKTNDGTSHPLNRNLTTSSVATKVNEARGKGQLIEFQNNETPSRSLYIDPDHVVSIADDGYHY